MVAGETIFADTPATQLAPAADVRLRVLFACSHSEIIRAVYESGCASDSGRSRSAWKGHSLALPSRMPPLC